jgi:hypothetical protein
MSETLTIAGTLSKGDAKKLTNAMRGSTVGPTTLYYAGVTAPVIGAGMALVAQAALHMLNVGEYWETMLSAIFAAMAGICWYLIFMRWSYRQRHGRASETSQETQVTLCEAYVSVKRGEVETRIGWAAIKSVHDKGSYTLLDVDGAATIMLPKKWFGKDKAARKAFIARVKQGMSGEWPVAEKSIQTV